ncbi:hypothetical protein BDA96_06G202100 [Sorghum bicolor]|uniref:Uncharacterized protein n=2 Tax=Sorghum bicolor TaxID=4558 RepID=A0A921QSM5_SORBI|nr:hypothetical protein BDA96_06G202100 [Sorghum bicolor]OQU82182.1 hypothetical protein SORBI_3006G185150 [Sorghum bicolor]
MVESFKCMTHGPLYHGCTASSWLEWEARIKKTETAGIWRGREERSHTRKEYQQENQHEPTAPNRGDRPLNGPVGATNHTVSAKLSRAAEASPNRRVPQSTLHRGKQKQVCNSQA